jgi:hypothetical protein
MHTPTHPTAFISLRDPRSKQYTAACSLRTQNLRRATINFTTHSSPGLPVSTTPQPRPTHRELALRRVPTRHKLPQPQAQKSRNALRSSRTAPPPRAPARRRSRLTTNGAFATSLLITEPTNATHQARARRRRSLPTIPRPDRLSPFPIRLYRGRPTAPRKCTRPRNASPQRRSAKACSNTKPVLGFWSAPWTTDVAGSGPVFSFVLRGETGVYARLAS